MHYRYNGVPACYFKPIPQCDFATAEEAEKAMEEHKVDDAASKKFGHAAYIGRVHPGPCDHGRNIKRAGN